MSEHQEKRKRKGGEHRRRQDHAGAKASLGKNVGGSASSKQQHPGNQPNNGQNIHSNSRKKRGRKNNNSSNPISTGEHNQTKNSNHHSKSNKNIIDTASIKSNNSLTLHWKSSQPHIMPLAVEEDMLKVILRWGERERGMMRDAPPFRLAEIQKRCQRHGIPLSQACSLRRHHMSLLNPYKSKESMQLGSLKDIKRSAELFEDAIAAYLHKQQISFWSEEEQKAEFLRTHPGQLIKGTPDFKLKQPILLTVVTTNHENHAHGTNNQQTQTLESRQHNIRLTKQRTIHWIEAKMFYGASTIPHDDRSAVGSILSKQKKYVKLFGEGAIVFSQGCGERLAVELDAIGVTALGCIGNPDIDLQDLKRHQRTWCGDKNGNILP